MAGTQHAKEVRVGDLPAALNTIRDVAVLPPLQGSAGTRLLVLSEEAVLVVTLPE